MAEVLTNPFTGSGTKGRLKAEGGERTLRKAL